MRRQRRAGRLARTGECAAARDQGGVVEEVPAVADETKDMLRRALVIEALRALTPAHREALNETVLRDRTVNRAAEALGIPAGTVTSRVYYALKTLRVLLAERGVSA